MKISVFRPVIASLATIALAVSSLVFQPAAPQAEAQTSTPFANDFDYAADFDGTTSISAASTVVKENDFTVEAWVNPRPHTGTEPTKTIVAQSRATSSFALSLEQISSSYSIVVKHGDTTLTVKPSGGVPSNTWSHIAVAVGSSSFAIYFNGVEIGRQDPLVAGSAGAASFAIGATAGTPAKFFNGQIDQVKVWNQSIDSSSELSTSMHTWGAITNRTLAAHYDFNDRSAANGKVFDRVATTGYHLDIKGAVDFTDVKTYREQNAKQIFTFPRTYLTKHGGWKVPAGVTSATVLTVGAGGAGGRGFVADTNGGGGGGGGGQVKVSNFAITGGTYTAVKVGQGGVEGPSSSNGQASSYGTNVTSLGGGAGIAGVSHRLDTFGGVAAVYTGTEAGGYGGGGGGGEGGSRYGGGGGGAETAGNGNSTGGRGKVLGQSVGTEEFGFLPGEDFGGGGAGGITDGTTTVFVQGTSGGRGGYESAGNVPGESGKPNRGGGGGGGSDGGGLAGNGGSGLVIVAIEMVTRCMYATSEFTTAAVPKIRFIGIPTRTPDFIIASDSKSVAAFYSEPTIVGDRMYVPDRGRGQLRSMNLDGSDITSVGSLPSPGLGATSDERYVYAWNSTGIARYDTQTGAYLQTYIGRGDILKKDGEIAFARYRGVGYLFLTNNVENSTNALYNRVYAVPISGVNPITGAAITAPATISSSEHYFSESRVANLTAAYGGVTDPGGSSGLAVIGDKLYWSIFGTSGKASLWVKQLKPENLPGYPLAAGVTPDTTRVADERLLANQSGLRTLSSDSLNVYYQVSNAIYAFQTNFKASQLVNANTNGGSDANGTLPVATCPFSPSQVSAGLASEVSIAVGISSVHPETTVGHRIEYRINGGEWIQAQGTSTNTGSIRISSGTTGLAEVRVAADFGLRLSEFTYAAPFLLGPDPTAPLCEDPTKLVYEVPAGTRVQFRLTSAGTPVTIGWGDGVVSKPFSWVGSYLFTKDYSKAGTYTIQICGNFTSMGESRTPQYYLKAVESWGTARETITSLSYAFRDAKILVDVPSDLPRNTAKLDYAFLNAETFNDPDVKLWDTGKVTTFKGTFAGAAKFNQDLGAWDVSSALETTSMFQDANEFNNGNSDSIKNWDTSKVTNMRQMFSYALPFNQPLASRAFNSSGALAVSVAAGSSSTKEVSTLTFTGTYVAGDIIRISNASNYSVPVVLTAAQVATVDDVAAAVKAALDLAGGAKYDITRAGGVLTLTGKVNGDLTDLAAIKQASAWDVSKVTSFDLMFSSARVFNQDISNWDTRSATSMAGMFSSAWVFDQNLGAWDVSKVTNFGDMFSRALVFNNAGSDSIKNWVTSAAVSMGGMFSFAREFNQPITETNSGGVARWDVSNVLNMSNMFLNASKFNQPLTWKTSKVSLMSQMFQGTLALTNIPDLKIDKLTNATNMLSYSGLTDDQYGTFMVDLKKKYDATDVNLRPKNVVFGAMDKTAFCDSPNDAVRYLIKNGNWTISDKTVKTPEGFCTPTVTITAAKSSHVYGDPVPSIGFSVNPNLAEADWLSQVECKAVLISDGSAVQTNSPVAETYKTVCTGPSGTGLGIDIVYADGAYSVKPRPITVAANTQAIFSGQAIGATPSETHTDDATYVMVTSGTLFSEDRIDVKLAYNKIEGQTAAMVDGTYSGSGTMTIVPSPGSGNETGNYKITFVSSLLTVSSLTYIIEAKSQTKPYGNTVTFGEADYQCTRKVETDKVITEGACQSIPTVSLSSTGATNSANVDDYAIVVGEVTLTGAAAADIEKVNGVLSVVKRKLTINPDAKTVAYGSDAPGSDFYTFSYTQSDFAPGQTSASVVGDFIEPTCTSGYNPETPRGTQLPITCTGGSADNYEFVMASQPGKLTVPALSTVAADVPQEISLGEGQEGTDVAFNFQLAPVNEICFATLLVYAEGQEIDPQRVQVNPGQPLNFSSPLIIGAYEYDLFVDGNCSIPQTRGLFSINEYVAPEPQPEAEAEDTEVAAPVAPNPYSGPIVTDFSARVVPADKTAIVTIDGSRLDVVTEAWIGDKKITFTRTSDGKLVLNLPAMPAGVYDLKLGFDGGGTITHIAAFTVLAGDKVDSSKPVPEGLPKVFGSRTLRYTNFGGDAFTLPMSARTGITRTLARLDDVTRVVCRGFTSATRVTAQDQRLATRRAQSACDLAKRSAPQATIELRTSPAAGVGPRFRAVNLFIVYELD